MRTRHLHAEIRIDRPPEAVFSFFSDPRNLERITPPWLRFHVEGASTGPVGEGTEIDYRLRLRGVPIRWRSRITVWDPPFRFVDEQIEGPYRLWRHLHSFEREGNATLARDWVEYAAPGGALVRRLVVDPDLARIFSHRARALAEVFARAV